MGRDPTPLAQATLAGWADQIAALVRSQAEAPILVGHSRGGLIISEVAERTPDDLRSLVYVSAFLGSAGQTLMDLSMQIPNPDLEGSFIPRPDGSTILAQAAIGSVFYNCTEPALIRLAEGSVSAEPATSFVTPLAVTDHRFGTVPRFYVECLRDKAIPLDLQRWMVRHMPCSKVYTLDADHSPFFSRSAELAESLCACASEAPSRQAIR